MAEASTMLPFPRQAFACIRAEVCEPRFYAILSSESIARSRHSDRACLSSRLAARRDAR
jgi:hypothetical protein